MQKSTIKKIKSGKRSFNRASMRVVKKEITNWHPRICSRHPSHNVLRNNLPLLRFKSIVRLGSETDLPDTVTRGGKRIECNTIEGIQNTSNKIMMKEVFSDNKIKSPSFIVPTNDAEILKWAKDRYPVIIKIENHSRGRGMDKIDDEAKMKEWLSKHDEHRHIFEEFVGYGREYRLHMSQGGCFYCFRKMRKSDAKEKWFFNSSNCAWILETNPLFDKPKCWDNIIKECKKALTALKLDIGGFDVRVSKDGSEFTIIEANSACSFGDITAKRYIAEISKILIEKHNG